MNNSIGKVNYDAWSSHLRQSIPLILRWEKTNAKGKEASEIGAKAVLLYALDLMASAGITPSEAAAQLRAGMTIEEVCAAAEVEQPAGFGPDTEITFVPDDAFGLPLKSDGNLCRLCGGPALCGAACSSCLRDGLRADYGYIDTPDGGLRPPT